jgi:hypothetical protein
MGLLSVYTTIHSSNHAGESTPSRAKQGFFPTTSRVSRKHPLLSDNRASLSETIWVFPLLLCISASLRYAFLFSFAPLSLCVKFCTSGDSLARSRHAKAKTTTRQHCRLFSPNYCQVGGISRASRRILRPKSDNLAPPSRVPADTIGDNFLNSVNFKALCNTEMSNQFLFGDINCADVTCWI